MATMAEERTRVDFNAPKSLVQRADVVADVLDVSRTRLLVDALEDELDSLAGDEGFRRRLRDAYYAGRIGFETVETVMGTEEAMRMRLLRDSLDRDPPEPRVTDADLPSPEAFYEDAVPEWTSGDESDEDGTGPLA